LLGGLSTAEVFLELVLIMGCYLEDYRARVCIWATRTTWHAISRNIDVQVKSYLENSCLFAADLAILLVIGGVEQNPGPDVEVESFRQVLCSRCERILKSGTQCGNVKVQLVDSGEWNCERCKWERLCLLEEKLQTL
jgi:predicted nucleic-acid-binding Zn-ribbon protein